MYAVNHGLKLGEVYMAHGHEVKLVAVWGDWCEVSYGNGEIVALPQDELVVVG